MKFINTVLAVFSTRIIEKIIRQVNSIIISRSLGPGGLGLYTLFFAVAKNLHTFSEFGLGASGIYFIRRKLSEEKKIIENSILFSIVVGILLSVLVFIFRKQLGSFLLDDQSHFILLLSLVIPMIMIATIFSTLIRGMKKFKIFNLFTIIKPFCFLVFIFIGLIIYNGDVITAIIGQITAILVSGFWIIYKMKILSSFNISFHKKLFYDSFKYGFKQHILKIIMMLLSTSPIYILKVLTSKEIVGQYGIILTLLGIISFLKMSISLVLTPEVSEMKDEEVHLFIAKVARNTLFIIFIISFIASILGPIYINFLYGINFAYASKAFRWFLPGIIFHSICVMLHRDFTARENPVQYKAILAYFFGAVFSILGSYILIYNYSEYPLEALGVSYNLSYLTVLVILTSMFVKDSNLQIRQVFVLNNNDRLLYIEMAKSLFKKFKNYRS